MDKFRNQIYINKLKICARQKSYGFKNLVKLGRFQTNFKITLGTRVFKKSCSTSQIPHMMEVFSDKFGGFCSKSRFLERVEPTKPNQAQLIKPRILQPGKPSKQSKAKQIKERKQFKPSKQTKQTKANQANQANQASKTSKAKQNKIKWSKQKTKQTKHKPRQLKRVQDK